MFQNPAWFAADVAAIKESGIIEGYPDGRFGPYDNMTRAEMAVILQRAFNLQDIHKLGNRYTDITPSYWAYDAIVTISNMDSTSLFAGEQLLCNRQCHTCFLYNSYL